jgi:negative regulator of flagellin synthesis FlgM
MDIRNSLEGLSTLLGTAQTSQASTASARTSQTSLSATALGTDSATVSSAASQVAQSASESGVRMDKVTGIQAALAAGTYTIDNAAVASKLVDSMLS